MTTHKEALKLALEALEPLIVERTCEAMDAGEKAITAIKEALAQPEQDPVAWWIPKAEQFCLPSSDGTRPFAKAWEPLYTTPPQRTWVGLTAEERDNFWKADQMTSEEWQKLFAEVEAKLKEKNTK